MSALVTNPVTHSDCHPQETIVVRAVLTGDCLCVSVRGPCCSAEEPTIAAKDRADGGGLGLRLVAHVAR